MSIPNMRPSSPTPLSAAALPSFDPDTLSPTRNRIARIIGFLDNSLRLPDNPRAFGLYLVALLVIFIGAFLHVLMAAQIMQTRYTLSSLEREHVNLERENGNLVYVISTYLNQGRLYTEAGNQGYITPELRTFVVREAPAVAQSLPETATATSAGVTATEIAVVAEADTTLPIRPAPAAQPDAERAVWQSWGEFWVRMWRPATRADQPVATQPAPDRLSGSRADAPGELPAAFLQEANARLTTWWQQSTTRAELLFEQMVGR
jgi:hypothetical protein